MTEVTQERELPASQIALAWMLHHPAIAAPIVGATKINHLDDAVAALSIKLSSGEIDGLENHIGHIRYRLSSPDALRSRAWDALQELAVSTIGMRIPFVPTTVSRMNAAIVCDPSS